MNTPGRPGRTLGGGRILGSGRNLSPAVSPVARPQQQLQQHQQQQHGNATAYHQHKRNTSLLSPSESSLSLSSQTSNSPASTWEPQDIASQVSLGHVDNAAAAAAAGAGSRLVCPICNEEMMTLLQLNRHLDDLHQNLEEVEQDEVKTWFKTQMVKAKKFQPLAVLNQKLKGLDVFEPNDNNNSPLSPPSASTSTIAELAKPDPEELVTRTHWQRPGYQDVCLEPSCGKRLGGMSGGVNCRKCGKLFCEDHTMYQMKLSRSAQHEPIRGIWCRVCETCYKSRPGYSDHHGFERNHMEMFSQIRQKTVDKAHLEVSRLEKRLTKLTQLLANPPPEHAPVGGGILWPLTSAKSQQRALEQTVITWEEDAKVPKCPFCHQEFTGYTFRKHHCRLCGRVVCGDAKTLCSTEMGLAVASLTGKGNTSVDVRMCKECKHTLFSRRDTAQESAKATPDQRAYENLTQFERGIRLLLPKFQKLLLALQDPEKPPSASQLQDASKVRKRLMDAFSQFDTAARRIRDFPTTSATQQRLQKAVYQQAYSFLSLHMLPLKSLPKILKHASPTQGLKSPINNPNNPRQNGALASIKQLGSFDSSSAVSSSSAAISVMEAEEKELRERLIVLEEQKFFVSEMISDANKRRKFDEVSALAQNMEDLNVEIDQINGQLGQLDFAAAYEGGGLLLSPPPVP